MQPTRRSTIFFTLSFLLILYLFYQMLRPFLIAIILSLTLVCLFYPNYEALTARLRGHRNVASMIMCTIITIIIIIPAVVFSVAVVQEFNEVYQSFQGRLARGEVNLSWLDSPVVRDLFERFGRRLGFQEINPSTALSSAVDRAAEYLFEHTSDILGGIGSFLLNFGVMIFGMFFFFRDGDSFLGELKRLIPMDPRYEDMVLQKLKEVIYATFLGAFATGILQGVSAGFIFAFLGIPSPVLWGTATAVLSFVPMIGTAGIWVPMAVYLIFTGSVWKGILLLVLGATAIGLLDNFVRPFIIEGRAEGMHVLLIFFSILGGVFLFGAPGLVLGPLVAALLITFIEIYKIEFTVERT